ncbi:MAG TPA: hypothetical protein VJT31_12980 [Rugosimonospora sp.]|nr:hypothetical protein [Rugosimonospora sp.]
MKLRRLFAAAGAFTLLGVLFAEPAHAATFIPAHIEEVEASVSGAQLTHASVTARCPAGMRVVSAGAGNAVLGQLSTTADGTGAVAEGFLVNPPLFIFAQADCVPAADLAGVTTAISRFIDNTGPVGAAALYSATAACPTGTYAISGGGTITNPAGTPTAGSTVSYDGPATDFPGWTFVGWAEKGDVLEVRAQCAPLPFATNAVITQFAIPPGGTVSGRANCPAGHVPLSGGALISDDGPNSSLSYSEAVRTVAPEVSGWFARASVGVQTSGAVLFIVAECL